MSDQRAPAAPRSALTSASSASSSNTTPPTFPLWLAPEQVRVLPIGDEAPLVNYAKEIQAELRAAGVCATIDTGTDPIKTKIADAEQMKVHTMLVPGHRDLEAGNVSVRVHGQGNLGAKPRAEVIADLLAAIKERRA